MIPAIILGRKNSLGFPGKNVYPVAGKPMMAYPLLAAQRSQLVERVYVSTDCPEIKRVAMDYGANVIDRPHELCSDSAICEDAYIHAYEHIRTNDDAQIEILVLLFCNAPTITPAVIDQGIEALRADPTLDSAVSVSEYNMWSPLRARRIGEDGLLHPFVPLESFGDINSFSSDRRSQGDAYFADMGVSIVRPHCLENIVEGQLPQKWMGKRIYPLPQWGGVDVDHEWQIPHVEYWVNKHGLNS